MKYPKVVSFGIKNFRNIEKAEISFRESPIVCLTGENESGKSSFTIASAVLGVHAYPTKQTEYIRTGTSGFTILINFEDGTALYRKKNSNGNFYGIIKNGSIIWEINKIDPGGVPYEVQKIMGMIIEPETKEYMNIRTYRDSLLFVETTGGTNYKVIYNALKVDNLYKALRAGTSEYNDLHQKIVKEEQSIQTLQAQLRSIRLVDLEPAILIKDRLNKEVEQLKVIMKALSLKDKIEKLEAISKEILELYSLPDINESEIYALEMAYKNLAKLEEIKKNTEVYRRALEIETIDAGEDSLLNNGMALLNKLDELRMRDKYGEVSQLEEISEVEMSLLNSGMQTIDRLTKLESEYEVCERRELVLIDIDSDMKLEQAIGLLDLLNNRSKELNEVATNIESLETQIKNCGALVATCSKCGETVVVPMQ